MSTPSIEGHRTVRRLGPVAITGASGQVGTDVRRHLEHLPNEVRPLGRHDDLAAAITDAEVVVHLAGTLRPRRPDTHAQANLDTVAATVAALKRSAVQRVVFLSYIDADPGSANPYLRAKGEAEELVHASGTPAVVFRATHIYGPADTPGPTAAAMLSRNGRPVSVLGNGRQRYAWLARRDAVAALAAAALDTGAPTGTFELAGPQAYAVDDFVRRINAPGTAIRHLPPGVARLVGRVVPSLPAALVDVLLRDCLPRGDAGDTARVFRFPLHSLPDAW